MGGQGSLAGGQGKAAPCVGGRTGGNAELVRTGAGPAVRPAGRRRACGWPAGVWLAGFFPKRQRTALDCRGCCCLSHSGRTTRGPWSPEGWAQGQRLGVSKNVRGPVWGCWCRGPGSCTPHGARTGQRAPGARRKLALWAGVLRVLCSLSGWQLGSPCCPRSLCRSPTPGLGQGPKLWFSQMSQVGFCDQATKQNLRLL